MCGGGVQVDKLVLKNNTATFDLSGGTFTTGYVEVKHKSLDSFIVPTGTTGLVTIEFPKDSFGDIGFVPDRTTRERWLGICLG